MRANRLPAFMRGRLLAALTLAYMAGLVLGAMLAVPHLYGGNVTLLLAANALLLAIIALLLRSRPQVAVALLLIAMLVLGCCLYTRAQLAVSSFPVAAEGDAVVYGRAQTDSTNVGENRQRVQLAVRIINGQPWQGQIYVYYEGEPLLKGTLIGCRGQVMSFTPYGNPGAFDYGAYMRRQGIAAAVSCYYGGELLSSDSLDTMRGNVRSRLLSAFGAVAGDDAGLLRGVFLGDKTDLSFAQRSALTYSGMMHTFSVSGMHVGYLIALAMLLAGPGRKRRWLRLGLVGLMLLFYLNLTGTPAPVLRAALMAVCILMAGAFDEKSEAYTALALAALLCLLYQPMWLLDAGFQLSFAAAFGLSYLLPPMRRLLGVPKQRHKATAYLLDGLAVALAASFATMPLISYYFYNISIVSWLLSVPFALGTGLAVICCFAASLLAVFSAALAQLPLHIADITMGLLYNLSDYGSSLPWAYISSGHTPAWAVVCFYVLLLLMPFLAPKFRRPRLFFVPGLGLLIILLSLSPVLTQALSRPAGQQLEVVFLDVGQGDAALIITPGGKTILIDGGGNRLSPGSVGQHVLIPYLRYRGLRSVDVLISSHPDEDHIDGLLTVLEHLPVGQLLYADVFEDSEVQEEMLQLAGQNGAMLTPAFAGQRFSVEDGLTLEVYHPQPGASYGDAAYNDGSLTVLLTYGQVSFLFTGDVVWKDIENIPQAQVVKVPHHGSKNNYDEQAYEELMAEAVIFSAGRDNSYGHPAPIVVEYWQDRADIFRTDTQGAITVFSDGNDWQAVTFL